MTRPNPNPVPNPHTNPNPTNQTRQDKTTLKQGAGHWPQCP